MFFRAYTKNTHEENAEAHFVKINEEGFLVNECRGNCLRLGEGLEFTLGQYSGYPANLKRDGIGVVFMGGILDKLRGYTTMPIRTIIPGQSPQEHTIVITQEGFQVDKKYLGDCLLLQLGQPLVLMRSRRFFEAAANKEEKPPSHRIAIVELVEVFGTLEPSKQIPLRPT